MFSPAQFTQSLKTEARRLGFDFAGACPAVSPRGFESLIDWLADGFEGEMDYFANRMDAYRHPRSVMPGAVSLLMLALNYKTEDAKPGAAGTGRISRYAWGSVDYHDLIREKLNCLQAFALEQLSLAGIKNAKVRGVVDTAPLLEREFAQLAGLGWRGKNTMLIRPQFGSWFFLAALLLNVELEYDSPFTADHCGTCTACLDACPTDAFPQPGVLNATRCISYLTIEHRTEIDPALRPMMGDWILGCDICQDVCPWNRKAPASANAEFYPTEEQNPLSLRELFQLTDEEFRARFRKTPLWRPKRRGILRNAAIALGNRPHVDNVPALAVGLNDNESLIRGACAWALGQHRFPHSIHSLIAREKIELDPDVCREIQSALASLGSEI